MNKTERVGIMGGTFNPIHNGHIKIAEVALKQLHLDKIIFIPSGNSYLKTNVLPSDIRVNMVSIAIADNPLFELSLIEVNRPGKTYTYETLQELSQSNPSTQYFFLLGADSLMYIENWLEPKIIFSLATICCAVREDTTLPILKAKEKELKKLGADIIFLDMPRTDISSSEIRQMVKAGKSIKGLVPDKVEHYIIQENVYENY